MERLVLEKRCFIIHAPQFLRGVKAGIACVNGPRTAVVSVRGQWYILIPYLPLNIAVSDPDYFDSALLVIISVFSLSEDTSLVAEPRDRQCKLFELQLLYLLAANTLNLTTNKQQGITRRWIKLPMRYGCDCLTSESVGLTYLLRI